MIVNCDFSFQFLIFFGALQLRNWIFCKQMITLCFNFWNFIRCQKIIFLFEMMYNSSKLSCAVMRLLILMAAASILILEKRIDMVGIFSITENKQRRRFVFMVLWYTWKKNSNFQKKTNQKFSPRHKKTSSSILVDW